MARRTSHFARGALAALLIVLAAGCSDQAPAGDDASDPDARGDTTPDAGDPPGADGGSDAGGDDDGGTPDAPPTQAQPFAFFAFGDTRDGTDIVANVARSMVALDPDAVAVINGGDIVHDGYPDEWAAHHAALAEGAPDPSVPADPQGIVRQSRLRTDAAEFGDFIRYFGVRGNHDDNASGWYELWNSYLSGQAGLGENSPDGIYYSFTHGNALFIVLDSTHPSPAQTEWLTQVLSTSDAFWKFAFFHHPIYPCNEKTLFTDGLEWVTLFEQYGVDMAFVAHSHTYERTCPMIGGQCAPDGVVYLNTSAGGVSPRPIDPTRTDTITDGVRTDTFQCSEILESGRGEWQHFCHVSVEGCQMSIECTGDDYARTGEAPYDSFVIDRC